MHRRVVEIAADEDVDAVVQRGGEQQALRTDRGLVEDALDARQEAEVGHVVRLVEHGHFDLIELAVALVHQVFETAGAGDEDVDAGLQRVDLRALADAAEDGGDFEAHRRCERGDRLGDLVGELTGRDEDQCTRLLWLTALARLHECGDGRDGEGDRLATAGLAAAEQVAAGHRVRQGRRLDRERSGDAATGEHFDHRGRNAEDGEVSGVDDRRRGNGEVDGSTLRLSVAWL